MVVVLFKQQPAAVKLLRSMTYNLKCFYIYTSNMERHKIQFIPAQKQENGNLVECDWVRIKGESVSWKYGKQSEIMAVKI